MGQYPTAEINYIQIYVSQMECTCIDLNNVQWIPQSVSRTDFIS